MSKKEQPVLKEKEITTKVLAKITAFTQAGELQIPKDFSPANALKGAMLILQEQVDRNKKPVLEVCTQESIAKSLLKMCIEGLSPIKGQGYFIPYGPQLTWIRSFQGSIALARRYAGVKDVVANVVYENDEFAFRVNPETGYKELLNHSPSIENIDNTKIKGAYAVVIYNDGRRDLEVMTLTEIKTAWGQGATKGNSGAHTNFTQEMCKKTVINRACKGPINSSSDSALFDDGESNVPTTEVEDVELEIVEDTASESLEIEMENKEAPTEEGGPVF